MKLTEKVEWLMTKSGMTAYSIAKEIGEPTSNIYVYTVDPSKIRNMRLHRAELLGELFDKLQEKKK
ncbi:hypothetical protein AB9M75_08170 [Lactobacillus sp. AN1001]